MHPWFIALNRAFLWFRSWKVDILNHRIENYGKTFFNHILIAVINECDRNLFNISIQTKLMQVANWASFCCNNNKNIKKQLYIQFHWVVPVHFIDALHIQRKHFQSIWIIKGMNLIIIQLFCAENWCRLLNSIGVSDLNHSV